MQDNRKNTRSRIIDSAEEIFAQNGFGGARIKDISACAGVTSAMIHYYFNNKEELHRAVLTRMIEDLADLVGKIAPEPIPPVVKLKLFFEGFFDYASRHRNFARITSMETGHDNNDYFIDLIKKNFRPMIQDAKSFLNLGIEQGVFRSIDTDQLLAAIYGMTVTYFSDSLFLEILLEMDATKDDVIRKRRELLMDMIFSILLKDPSQGEKLLAEG